MGPEIVIPAEVADSVRENTWRFIDSLFDVDAATGTPRKRPGAASVVALMERSGAVLGAGIAAFFAKHQITDPELIYLSHMGYELEHTCDFWNPLVAWFVEEHEYMATQQKLREVAASDHPFADQVRKLAQALSRLPSGQHELRVVDDYVHDGVVSEWILPVAVRVAAEQAGYAPHEIDIRTVSFAEMVQYHFFNDEARVNDFSVTLPLRPDLNVDGRRIIYDPYRLIEMTRAERWVDDLMFANFGNNYGNGVYPLLDDAIRGPVDYEKPVREWRTSPLPDRENPSKNLAILLEKKGVPLPLQDAYMSDLRSRICATIVTLTGV